MLSLRERVGNVGKIRKINFRKLIVSSLNTSTMNPWVSLRKWSSRKLAIKKNKFCPLKTNDTRIFESQEGKQVNMTTSRILDEVESQMRRSHVVKFRKDITKKEK